MIKIYKSKTCAKRLIFLFVFLSGFCFTLSAQVSLTATFGITTGNYTTLREAFDAINSGNHQGDIVISISANTDEGTIPATLNSSDADPATYSSVYIRPMGNNIIISGKPAAGMGVIQLNGADNVTIDGDNPNTAGQARNLTVNNTADAAVVGGSCIRVATSATIESADGITIINCNLNGNVINGNLSGVIAAAGSSNISFGIYAGGNGGLTPIDVPEAITAVMEAAPATSSMKSLTVQNNQVNQCGKGIVFNGADPEVSNGVIITNNIIGASAVLGAFPYTTPGTTVYTTGIWIAGTTGANISTNTIQNIMSYVGGPVAGIELNANMGTGVVEIRNNIITNIVNNNNASTNISTGISINSIGADFTVSGNTITKVENIAASATSPAGGIRINNAGGAGTIEYNKISGIYNRHLSGYPAQGINLHNAANFTVIRNNFISNIMNTGNSSFGNTLNVNGILLHTGGGHKVYHNSVNLYGNSTASTTNSINCLAISSVTQLGIDIRNNIFSNTVAGAGASNIHTCIFMPFVPTAAMNLTINNNAYYTGSGTVNALGFAGGINFATGTSYTVGNFQPLTTAGSSNWRAVTSGAGNGSNDFASYGSTAAAPFVSPTDLHIPAATNTQAESGGVALGITNDIDLTPRHATFPDMGADEFMGTNIDVIPPAISYTPLLNTCVSGNRTLSVTIKDPSNVPTAGAGLPVLYWRINTGGYTAVTGVFISGSTYDFTFGAGAGLGDVVYYYIVAQDAATIPNVIASPSSGAGGYSVNPPAAATKPTTPESYKIQGSLAPGVYDVGIGQTYTTIGAAIDAYNNSCLSGGITFRLIDGAYTAETFPIVIGNPLASVTNTLTIVPEPGQAVLIEGSNPSSLFKLNGADYVTIDGLNTGGSSLTIKNNNTAASSAVIWIAADVTNGATNNVIRNCSIFGAGPLLNIGGIIAGNGSTLGNPSTAANNNNMISNCVFKGLQNGIYISGYPGTLDNGWIITNNNFGVGTSADKMGYRGLSVQWVNNFTISNNVISGVTRSSSVVATGIAVFNNSTNGTISKNRISDIRQTVTSSGAYGILLSATGSTSNIAVNNNFIWDVSANGSATLNNNATGIYISSGGGYNIDYNSINLATDQTAATSITAALRIAATVSTPGSVNVRNNIFANTIVKGTRYAIYMAAGASVFGTIDNNDYYTGSSPVLGFLGGGRQTLAAWRSVTGDDARSISINPGFVSATDLHLTTSPASPLNGYAQNIPSVTTDIDNDSRTNPSDIGADDMDAADCDGSMLAGTIDATTLEFCNSGTVNLVATDFATGDGVVYQWWFSTDGGSNWTALSGQDMPFHASMLVTQNTAFKLVTTCDNTGDEIESNIIDVIVNKPQVLSHTNGVRCGTGTVQLAATTTPFFPTLKWYAAPTGGVAIGTGPTFTTPVITATTNFYVSAEIGGTTGSVGPASPTAQGGTIGTQTIDWEVFFDVLQATTFKSVDIFPMTAGSSSNLLLKNSSGVLLATIPYTTLVSGGLTAQTIPINFALPPGTGYYIEGTIPAGGLRRNTSGAVYPYTSSVINIKGNGFSSAYYMCYYNFQFSSACASPRTAVTATVTPAPAINAVATPAISCTGTAVDLTVTSANTGYTYVWNPGNLPGATVSVTPTVNSTYIVTANDNSGGPNHLCALLDTVTVTTRPFPTTVTVNPATKSQCSNVAPVLLTASGGTLSNVYALNEDFNAPTNNWTTINNSTGGSNPAAVAWTLRPDGYSEPLADIHSNDNSQFYQTDSDAQGSGGTANTILQSPAFSLVGYTSANLSFWQHYNFLGAGESANVEASTDGSLWNSLAVYTSDQGTITSFLNSVISLNAYVGAPVVYVRFRYANATFDWHWCIDNVSVAGTVSTGITWTQAPAAPNSLFTDAAGTIPYTAGAVSNTVYVKPGVNTVYTATSTAPGPSFCKSTATSTFTVTSAVASVAVTALPAGTVCSGTSVTFTATPTNGGPGPVYQWFNGATAVGTGATYTSAALNNGDIITVQITSNEACAIAGNPYTSPPVVMDVSPIPTCLIAGDDAVCAGSTDHVYTSTVSPVGGVETHSWTISGNGTIDGAANGASVTVSAGATGSFILTDNITRNGCVSSCTKTVTVNPNVPVSVVISTATTTVCSGNPVTFNAVATNGGTTPTFQWQVNGFNEATGNPFITSTLVDGDVVTVILTSNDACGTGSPATSNSLVMEVVSSAAASVALDVSATLCTGVPITFTALPTNGGPSPNYEFFLNTVSVQNGTSDTYILTTPVNGDDIYVVMTSSFSCAAGGPATSTTYTVTLNASPTISATADCNNIITGSGQVVLLTATAAPGSGTIGANSYQWLLAGNPVPGETSVTYSTGIPGSYTVSVTNSNGCTSTSTIPVIITGSTPALAGTYVIPASGCNGFDKISTAVNYLNTHGISASVIFNIAPGYTETAPVGGYAITATGTAANTITFQRNGAGNMPVITAGLQAAGSNTDAIFKIIGGDYITIRNLTLQENTGNTVVSVGATNTMTEWGVALLYATNTNGPNNNTIENNDISLRRTYPNSFGIYSNLRHSAVNSAVLADLTNTTGGNNKVYGNVISNVSIPVLFLNPGTAMNSGNEIGGTSAATGNTLTNWGNNLAPNTTDLFYGVPKSLYGVYAANQTMLNIRWNIISSSPFANVTAGLRGIYCDFVSTAPTGTFTNAITNNTIALKNAATSGIFEGITHSNTINTPVPGYTLNINNNAIHDTLTGTGALTTIVGITNAFPAGNLSISDNLISGNTSTATAAGFTGIVNSAAVTTTINLNNNQIGDALTNAITFSAVTNGVVFGISNTGANAAATLTISGNSITRIVHTLVGTGGHTYINSTATPATQNITNNTISGISTNSNGAINAIVSSTASPSKTISGNIINTITGGAGNMVMISAASGTTLSTITNNIIGTNTANNINGSAQLTGINITNVGSASTVTNNTVSGLNCTGTGASLINGINANSPTLTITGNSINSISSSGAASNIYGIFLGGGTTVNVSQNSIHTLAGSGTGNAAATGILSSGGASVNIFRNTIYNLSQSGAGTSASMANGIQLSGGTTVTVYNNMISDLRAPNASVNDALRGISVTATGANTTYNVYYNTIYLNASSAGVNFGTTGLFHTGSAATATAKLTLRNNIIVNVSGHNGSGKTVAFRKANIELANYDGSSNNNDFYAGVPSTDNLLFFNGTAGDATISDMQLRLSTRDAASISVLPDFENVATTPYDLRLKLATSCAFDGAGNNAGILIPNDIDGEPRAIVSPFITDIGADEFVSGGGGPGVWKGVNSDWNNLANWCDGIPTSTSNVTIPAGADFYPIITTTDPVVNNITIAANASVTVTGSGKIGIYGTITNNGTFNVADGTVEMAGPSGQTIPANAFLNNNVKNLIVSNSGATATLNLGGPLNLIGKLSFTGSSRTFATAGNLTLKSTATGTASVGDITNNGANTGNTITGDVVVERYITAKRAWRYLSMPTQHNAQTIHESWQENMPANSPTPSTPAGYGIHITKDSVNAVAHGFDIRTPLGGTMKTFVPADTSWKSVTSTINVPGISNGRFEIGVGYMTLIRGDRTANEFLDPVTSTTLREKGAIFTGPLSVPVLANRFAGMGNPYPSAIDFTKLTLNNLAGFFFVYDPKLGTLGGFQTISTSGDVTPGGGSYGSTTTTTIESGQGFFVQSAGPAGSVNFTEPAKVDGSNLVSRPMGGGRKLRSNLYVIDATGTANLFDGVLAEFDDSNSNSVNADDALKMVNFGENLSIARADKKLSVERRANILDTDTIFYNLTQVRLQNYRFEFIPDNMDAGLSAFLVDKHLQKRTPVSMTGSTEVNFTVTNNAGSYAADRFYIVFRQSAPVPVTFTTVRANRQDRNILVEWKVENQLNISRYHVERSADGVNFTGVNEQQARSGSATVQYQWLDVNPFSGDNFYRIRSVGANGAVKYSQVVKVSIKVPSQITVFPNPVGEDGMVYVNLDNKPAGVYQVSLLDNKGRLVHQRKLNHGGGSSVYSIEMTKSLAHGNYLLSVSGDEIEKMTFKVIY